MKYKAICFDIDGTLYPTSFLNKVMARMGMFHPFFSKTYSALRKEFRKCQSDFASYGLENENFSIREAAMLNRVKKHGKDLYSTRKYLDRHFYRRLQTEYSKLPRQENVVRTMEKLKSRGITIGIMSDWPLWNKLEKIGIAEYCDFACEPDQMGFLKPDAHTFQYLLYNLKLDPSEVLYVGDSYDKDILGATGVGMDAVLVRTRDRDGKYPMALKVFGSWEDFSSWVEDI